MSIDSVPALLGLLDPPVWVVTAAGAGEHGGLIATNVTNASIVPEMPRFVVGLARQHRTWQLVETSGALTLHLFTAEHIDWVWRFGLRSGSDRSAPPVLGDVAPPDKFTGLEWTTGPTGSPILAGALAWMACRVEKGFDTGDRTLFLVEVLASGGEFQGTPLTVKAMLALATPEEKTELKRLLIRDAGIDAEAIRAWRGRP